ncbi:hypothetical protein [Ruegeria arenilitoris]|uniref:hypothetical protein n=1 Tax=Ruegeria arenilitoris TaxID=1173585 RepID=UPI0014818890|nr:hypothetical protein [Ruegeria arenilitoris]
MIMRIFQVTTRSGKEDEFCRFFRDTAIPLMKSALGIVHLFSGRAERVVLTSETGPNRVRDFGYISGNKGVWRCRGNDSGRTDCLSIVDRALRQPKKFSVVTGWLALSRNSSGTTLLQETS